MFTSAFRSFRDLVLTATDKDYPALVHLPHSIISVARYRRWRLEEGEPAAWLYDFFVSFFSHSQGGGAGCKALIEGRLLTSYICRWDYTHFHFLAFLLSYWSPCDIVYRAMMQPRHPARLFCVAFDALDGITTTCAMVDNAVELHPRNKFLPAVMGIVLYNTGALVRWLDEKARGKSSKVFLAEPGSGVARGVVLAALYLYFGRMLKGGKSRNFVLVLMSMLEVVLEVCEDAWDFDAFAALHGPAAAALKPLQSLALLLRLGVSPPSPKALKGEVARPLAANGAAP